MSISSEIQRLQQAKADLKTSIEGKGVSVPSSAKLDVYHEYVSAIQAGGGSVISIVDTLDSHGGTVRTITAVSLEGDTVSPSTLVSGYTAHNYLGEPIVGTAIAGSINLQSKTVTPTESQQTVTADMGYDGLSSVTVNPIPSQYIVPTGNISITANGTGIDVSQYATASVNVQNTGKNIQVYRGYDTVNSNAYASTDVTITVAKSGTYNITWMGYRNTTSGTSGSQLYKNGTAVGNASTSFVNTYGHIVTLSNQTLNKNDVLVVWARARSAQYIMGVGNLIIEEV